MKLAIMLLYTLFAHDVIISQTMATLQKIHAFMFVPSKTTHSQAKYIIMDYFDQGATLYHCTSVPLYHCTTVPLYHCTSVLLYCTSVPLYCTSVPLYCTSVHCTIIPLYYCIIVRLHQCTLYHCATV